MDCFEEKNTCTLSYGSNHGKLYFLKLFLIFVKTYILLVIAPFLTASPRGPIPIFGHFISFHFISPPFHVLLENRVNSRHLLQSTDWTIVRQLSGSSQAIVRQLSGSHWQLSSNCQAVARQSSSSCQAFVRTVVRQSSVSHQVVRQSLSRQAVIKTSDSL